MCVKHYGYRLAIRIIINEAVQSGTWEGNVYDVPCDYHIVMLTVLWGLYSLHQLDNQNCDTLI